MDVVLSPLSLPCWVPAFYIIFLVCLFCASERCLRQHYRFFLCHHHPSTRSTISLYLIIIIIAGTVCECAYNGWRKRKRSYSFALYILHTHLLTTTIHFSSLTLKLWAIWLFMFRCLYLCLDYLCFSIDISFENSILLCVRVPAIYWFFSRSN